MKRNKEVFISLLSPDITFLLFWRCRCNYANSTKVGSIKTSTSSSIIKTFKRWSFLPCTLCFEPVSDITYMCQCFMSPCSDLCQLSTVQVKQRANECIMALDKLTKINSGMPVHNVLPTQFDWTALQVKHQVVLGDINSTAMTNWVCAEQKWLIRRASQTGLKTFWFFSVFI